jgi:valyl-tRNA synthetase
VPFRDVIIHSTVLAVEGGRMSKSLGTGIDPLEVIDQHGTDAVRYGLLKMSSAQDVRFNYGAIEEGRKLANKLWNASRLVLQASGTTVELRPQSVEERWMLARIDATRAEVEQLLAGFDFSHAVQSLYHLIFDDFCDWYLEAIKPRVYGGDADAQATALAALEQVLKLLHPFMPHVTEEIWTNLPARETRLIVAPWPAEDASSADALHALDRVQEAAATFRRAGVLVQLEGDEKRIFDAVVKPERQQANGDVEVERARLQGEIARAEKMLANDRFVQNAKPEVVQAEREKLERYRRELDALSG